MRFVLYAASTPHASELVETAGRLGWELAAAVRNIPGLPVPDEVPAPVEIDELEADLLALPFVVAQTNPAQRREAIADAYRRGFATAATMVDPTSVVARSSTIGPGSFVGATSVVGAGARIGSGSMVGRSCSLGHHVWLGDYASLGPGVVVAGSCRIETGAFLGAGAVLAPKIEIGAGALVGAGAVVIADVEPDTVVVGNPARFLRRCGAGDR